MNEEFENLISFENLYCAHRRSRLSKRHKKEVILFEAQLSKNLWELHYQLKYKKYTVGEYNKFMIHDPKEREIQAISYRDRVVQHCICDNYLTPLLNNHLIYDNSACRKNKGTTFAIKRLKGFMREYNKKYGKAGYFLKLDVKKYFPSINHDVLKQKLIKLVENQDVLSLLFTIIDSYNKQENVGLPMRNQTSQCFALLYLDELDRYFKQALGLKHYIRYMDDMIIVSYEKQKINQCLMMANILLIKNKLVLNPKSQAIAFKNGIIFLGWRFFLGKSGKIVQKISTPTKKRMFAKVKLSNFYFKCKKIKKEKILQTYQSYNGYLGWGNTFWVRSKLNKEKV